MRILLLYDCVYPEFLGGVEHRNYELARVLAQRGHRVTLAGFCEPDLEPPSGVELLSLGRRGELYTASGKRRSQEALRFARAVGQLDLTAYDLVETANIPYLHLPRLHWRCRRARRPLIVTWYEYWGSYWRRYMGPVRWRLYAAFERWTARFGDLRLASSRLPAERLERRGWPAEEILACGLDVATVAELARQGRAVPGPPLIYAGRLQREKRLEILLEAVALLAASDDGQLPKPVLTLVGDGPDLPRLKRLVHRLGLERHVVFAGRLPDSPAVWRRLGGARIAVQPSEREGFGMFPLEAMAAGLPVVHCASEESAVGELVRDGIEGREARADPGDLARILRNLLTSPGDWSAMSAAARQRAMQYDWSQIAHRFETFCRALLRQSPSHNPSRD